MQYSLTPLDKITSSIRKEVSKKLYAEYGIRKPVKSWKKGQGLSRDELKAVCAGIAVKVRWCTYFISGYEADSDSLELGQQVFTPCIETRKINLDNFADEYHPYYLWYSRGFGDGYSESAWDSSLDEDIPYPNDFPDDTAKKAYSCGRSNGSTQAMLDE